MGLTLVSPRDDALRGSQVCFAHPTQRLRDRAGADRARRGRRLPRAATSCASASRRCTLRFVDVWDAVEHLRQVLTSDEWREARFNQKAAVT